ncbi:hypothetical protein O3G_MSEX004908 [Manduca sexta]|uniref:Uncharacterized protein n=1 Tax=Manduca sexta TaxID=7130 RepID=A0A921YWU4_MANSE|nr:hypothetical protein O3G_MSEX004908 [Manduca sexta]
MRLLWCLCVAAFVNNAICAPSGFAFPDERRQKKLEPVITPPILPVLEHLERDPSTLLPNEKRAQQVSPKFGGGFNVAPSGNGGLTASVSSSLGGTGGSHSASQSFSFGFSEGFSASHSASQASSFNGFGSGFSGSQASSQAAAASFGAAGTSVSGAASQAAAFGGGFGNNFGSQSASSAFGFNTLNGFQPPNANFGDGLFNYRHRGIPDFPIPDLVGGKGIGVASFRSGKSRTSPKIGDDFIAVLHTF